MTIIFRLVLVLLIFSFIVYALKMIARLSHNLRGTIDDVRNLREQVSGKKVPAADLVRCGTCGAFVSTRDAVTISSRNRQQVFCSHECIRAQAAR